MYVSTKLSRDANLRYVYKILLNLVFLIQAEARVYCQDSHAKPWEPLGYSCPINCGNVITAAKKLRAADYGRLFSDQKMHKYETYTKINIAKPYKSRENLNKINTEKPNKLNTGKPNDLTTEHTEMYDEMRRNVNDNTKINTYRRYYKILNNEMVIRDLKTETKTAMVAMKACYAQNEVKNMFWNSNKCTKRSNIEFDFLKKFTAILNRYTKSVTFTEELTAMILEKVLGKNLDLRHGLFDVNKILVFLSTAIRNHEMNSATLNGQIISLKSRHCLSLNVMGCFCMAGFVEKSGQCVIPSDCFEGVIEKDLLARIIVY